MEKPIKSKKEKILSNDKFYKNTYQDFKIRFNSTNKRSRNTQDYNKTSNSIYNNSSKMPFVMNIPQKNTENQSKSYVFQTFTSKIEDLTGKKIQKDSFFERNNFLFKFPNKSVFDLDIIKKIKYRKKSEMFNI